MIGRLVGRVVGQDEDGAVVIDVGGVGYDVTMPLGTLGRASNDGELVTVHVHTHVREDALTLFGFASERDRAAFRALIGVSNVGPKIAIAVLGAMSVDELATAVDREEAAKLRGIAGVGAKTASRLCLELKGKLVPPAPTAGAPRAPAVAQGSRSRADQVTSALVGLGFRPAEAERAVQSLGERLVTDELPKLIKEALALVSR